MILGVDLGWLGPSRATALATYRKDLAKLAPPPPERGAPRGSSPFDRAAARSRPHPSPNKASRRPTCRALNAGRAESSASAAGSAAAAWRRCPGTARRRWHAAPLATALSRTAAARSADQTTGSGRFGVKRTANAPSPTAAACTATTRSAGRAGIACPRACAASSKGSALSPKRRLRGVHPLLQPDFGARLLAPHRRADHRANGRPGAIEQRQLQHPPRPKHG